MSLHNAVAAVLKLMILLSCLAIASSSSSTRRFFYSSEDFVRVESTKISKRRGASSVADTSPSPSLDPSAGPTKSSIPSVSSSPSTEPSAWPSLDPSAGPTTEPSVSSKPSVSFNPSSSPSHAEVEWILAVNYTSAEANQTMGLSVALSGDGTVAAIGGKYRVSLYQVTVDGWSKLTSDLCQYVKGSKIALSSNGQHVVVADPKRDTSSWWGDIEEAGQVQVFSGANDNEDNKWKQVGSTVKGVWSGYRFGIDVDVSDDGERIVVGEEGAFAVQVYDLANGEWSLTGTLSKTLSSADSKSNFGTSLSMTGLGTWLVVSDSKEGKVYVYDLKLLLMFQEIDAECFGNAVALSSDARTFATTRSDCYDDDESVLLYVYDSESKRFQKFDTSLGGFPVGLSHDVSLSGDGETIAITTSREDPFSNDSTMETVYVHKLRDGVWTKAGSFPSIGERLRVSLSDDGTTLAVGAPKTDYDSDDSTKPNGHVRVYQQQTDESPSSYTMSSIRSSTVASTAKYVSLEDDECSYLEEGEGDNNNTTDDFYSDWSFDDDCYNSCGDNILCSIFYSICFFIFYPFYLVQAIALIALFLFYVFCVLPSLYPQI